MGKKYKKLQIPEEIVLGIILFAFIGSSWFFFGKINNALSPIKLKSAQAQEKIQGINTQNVIFNGPRDKKQIALTFDADMTLLMKQLIISENRSPSYNQKIINILHETNTPATIFMTGLWIEMYPQITEELAKDPLIELENHSYAHIGYTGKCFGLGTLPDSAKIDDIEKTNKLLSLYTHKTHFFFRFPGGCFSQNDIKTVENAGDIPVQWDIEGRDGFNTDINRILNNILPNVKNGSIIVLHFNGAPTAPRTAEALPTIINTLKNQGYTFVTVSSLLN